MSDRTVQSSSAQQNSPDRQPEDASARDLISAVGLDQTLFVEAGAGTGKTTQLVQRIVSLVLEQELKLADIAAITFTEAAATELQARVRVAFETLAVDPASSPKIQGLCQDAIADADLAAISTVHGFASRILTEFSTAAGLPPRVTVLDEIASQLAHEQRWDRFVDRLHADPERHELLIRLSLMNIAMTPQYKGQASFKNVAASFNQNWDRLTSLTSGDLPPLGALDFSTFDRAVERLATMCEFCLDPDDKLIRRIEDERLPSMQTVVNISDPHRKLRTLASLPDRFWGPGSGGKNNNWSVDVKEVKDSLKAVTAAAEAVVSSVAAELIDQMSALVAADVLSGATSRQQSGGLEFHDLLVLARRVLRSNAEVRRVLHERYQAVLLDEFQDTDPIQIELASLIAATPADVQPDRWDEHQVDGGRLFFVGDAKQSIYRFRRADIQLFLRARDRYTGGSESVQLTTNFRTVEPIIDWVNGLFSEVMPEEIADKQPRYEPLKAWRVPAPESDHRPVILGGEHPEPRVRAGELRELEAEQVAALVAWVRDEPEQWPIGLSDDEDGQPQWREARLSDITILIPTRTSLPYLRTALEGHDLPYRLTTGTLVYDTQEVRDVLATLRAIDDPTDILSLVAALRSPLYGCSDVELFEFRQAKGSWNIRKEDHGVLDPDHRAIQALSHLRELWEKRWWSGPVALLDQILADREAHLLAFGHERPAEVWRRLRFLLDQARLYEEQVGTSIRGFIDWAGLQSSDSARVHEPLLPETDEDSIQISTVHGAKGLEFPITILSGMTTAIAGPPRAGVSVLWNADGEPEVKIRKGLASSGHDARSALEEAMDVYEKMRLLYVAATRARDHLVISVHHKAERPNRDGTPAEPRTYASRISRFCETRPELVCSVNTVDAFRDHNPLTCGGMIDPPSKEELQTRLEELQTRLAESTAQEIAAQDKWERARRTALEPARKKRVMSATAMARMVEETSLDLDPNDEDDDQADQGVAEAGEAGMPVIRRKGRAGSAIGRAVHNTLEHLDFANPGDVERQVARQCDLELIPELLETVLALVQSALGSEAIRLAVEHKAYKEIYVAAPLGETMVEGYVDLLIETPDGLIIVDYKTDSARTDAEVDKKLAAYELQGASYAVVLEESTGMKVIDCRFVFCNTGGTIERSVADLESAKQRVRELAEGGQIPGDGSRGQLPPNRLGSSVSRRFAEVGVLDIDLPGRSDSRRSAGLPE